MRNLKTNQQFRWPGLDTVRIEPIRLFLQDAGTQLIKFFQDIFADLKALQNTDLVDTLPTASSELRGRIFTKNNGAGSADTIHICIKNSSNTYEFKQVTIT